jgi:hypothetical protein
MVLGPAGWVLVSSELGVIFRGGKEGLKLVWDGIGNGLGLEKA